MIRRAEIRDIPAMAMMFMEMVKYHRKHSAIDPFTADENKLMGSVMSEIVKGIHNPNYLWLVMTGDNGTISGMAGGCIVNMPEMYSCERFAELEWFHPLSFDNRQLLDEFDKWAKENQAQYRQALNFPTDTQSGEVLERNGMVKFCRVYRKKL
jgi:hypothetical protein